MRFRLLTFAILTIPAAALASSNGIPYSAQARGGCTGNSCHSLVASPTTRVCIEGLPTDGTYAPGVTYDLNVFVDGTGIPVSPGAVTGLVFGGNVAGFALEASAGQVADVDSSTSKLGSVLSHTSAGRNHWDVRWTAPASGSVTFWLSGNAVNNTNQADAGDLWNRMQMTLAPGAGADPGIHCDPPIPLPQLVPRPITASAVAAH